MENIIYLDYAATTPVDPAVVDTMIQYMGPDGVFGNPASNTHRPGQQAAKAVENAREQVAELIEARPDEIVWTSGATEAINLAIKGVAHTCGNQGRHIVTSCLEHSAVLDTCRHLARKGYDITFLSPDTEGMITTACVRHALRDETILVSLMHVNNETGTVTDIDTIGEVAHERGIAFHVDAVQSLARLPLDARRTNADFISFSAHKMYGPKGIGALYVQGRSAPPIPPQIHGGDQELGLRAGTLATHQIVGLGKAAELLKDCRERESQAMAKLDQVLLQGLTATPQCRINGNSEQRIPGIANVRFSCVDNESLMMALRDEVAVSSGSACTSTRIEPSHVLLGLGLSEDEANSSVRVSLGRFTTEHDVRLATTRIGEAVAELRALSSDWERRTDWA